MKPVKVGGKWYVAKPERTLRAFGPAAGFPLDVEFETGRLDPLLRDYADLVRKAYWQANHPFWTHDILDTRGFGPANENSETMQLGAIDTIVWQAQYDPTNSEGPSRVGAELIAALTTTMPVDSGELTTDPTKLIGPEIGANAVLICQRLKYRTAHLYSPLIDAVVYGHTMAAIGMAFGGNSSASAKLGREKVKDGLLFAKLVFDDLLRQEREDDRRPTKQRAPENQFALGSEGDELPLKWQQADNDNRRRISDVA
jgi:hypothetical protein